MALYRHHEGQMTTYELTMGQIQTAEKHLALLDERPDVPDARPRAAQLPAHARAQLRGARRPARVAAAPAPGAAARPGAAPRPWVARRLVGVASCSDEVRARSPRSRRRTGSRSSTRSPSGVDLRVLFLAADGPAPVVLRPARARVALRARRACPGRSLQRGGRWLVLSHGARRSCGASRPTRSASAAGTSPPSGARSPTAKTRRIPLLVVGRVRLHATTRSGRAPLELAKRDARACVDGFFVPGQASADYVRSLGVEPDRRDRAERGRRVRLRRRRVDRSGDGTVHVPLRRAARPGEGPRHAARRVRATCRASSCSSARARRRPSCGHSPTTACRFAGALTARRGRQLLSPTPTSSCCRRARSRGGWC